MPDSDNSGQAAANQNWSVTPRGQAAAAIAKGQSWAVTPKGQAAQQANVGLAKAPGEDNDAYAANNVD